MLFLLFNIFIWLTKKTFLLPSRQTSVELCWIIWAKTGSKVSSILSSSTMEETDQIHRLMCKWKKKTGERHRGLNLPLASVISF